MCKLFNAQRRGVAQTGESNDLKAWRCKNVNSCRRKSFMTSICESVVGQRIREAEVPRYRGALTLLGDVENNASVKYLLIYKTY